MATRLLVSAWILAGAALSATAAHAMGLGGFGGGTSATPTQRTPVDRIGGLRRPTRLALADSGDLYVVDAGRGIVAVFDALGQRVGTLGGLDQPRGVAVLEEATTRTVTTCTTTADTCSDDEDEDSDGGWGHGRSGGGHHGRGRDSDDDSDDDSDADSCSTTTETCTTTTVTATVARAWVSDASDGAVYVYEDGEQVDVLGSGPGEFASPNGLDVTSDGTVWVVDSAADEVSAWDASGARTLSFGASGSGDGELDFPTDVAVDETAGEVYVADFKNDRVAVFDTGGTWLRNLDPPVNDAGDPAFLQPAGIGLDPDGLLYVVDNALMAVVIMDTSGNLVDILGYDAGTYWTGDVIVPVDAASDGATFWVSSSKQGRVHAYEVTR